MKPIKALWNSIRDIMIALIGGLFGAQIAIYFINQETFPLLVGTICIFAVILFIVYLMAKEDIPL